MQQKPDNGNSDAAPPGVVLILELNELCICWTLLG